MVFQTHLEAGATYRMLERAPMRSAADLSSSEVGKVAAAGTVAAMDTMDADLFNDGPKKNGPKIGGVFRVSWFFFGFERL